MKGDVPADPRGLIFEAFQMDLTPADCRTIFFDWALGRPEADGVADIARLLDHYAPQYPDHPMTAVLREGLEPRVAPPRRRRRRERP